MKNVLIALDLSAASESAIHFTLNLRKQLAFKLTVLHVAAKSENEKGAIGANEEANKTNGVRKTFQRFIQAYPNQSDTVVKEEIDINYLAEEGGVVESIIQTGEKIAADLIVIGTRKKHGLLDYLMGSVSRELIEQSTIPVLVIPEETQSESIQHMALATDIFLDEEPPMKFLRTFANSLKAKLDMVYVYPLLRDYSDEKEEVFDAKWFENERGEEAQLTIVRDSSTINGLDYFIEKHDVDLLALHIPQRSTLKALFHRSLSKQLVWKVSIPLLIC